MQCTLPIALATALALIAGCSGSPGVREPSERELQAVRAETVRLMPTSVAQREEWAADIVAALSALSLRPGMDHVCAVLAVTQQESGFVVDPPVPGLPAIARREIEARAGRYYVPKLVVKAALDLPSSNGRSYNERLREARTERALSEIFEDFIGRVPLGKRLFADWNPVRTGGPMQVSIAFAEQHAAAKRYPYPHSGSIRAEVFTRRGGLYFGIAHLLDYPASYPNLLYRFADFNAGHYASRNAAFQSAINLLTRQSLALDGDLLREGAGIEDPSQTELATRRLAPELKLTPEQIREDLERGRDASFERTRLYARVFELADARSKTPRARAVVPAIQLRSPKITRKLTTDWFARRVDERYTKCMARVAATSIPHPETPSPRR
jgi:hypothetical protein